MTSHRNLKAAVRRFAAERDIPYMEARRLMGLDELEFEFTDELTGLEVQAAIRQNSVDVWWFFPDDSQDYRASRTDLFLNGGIWNDARRPAHLPDGSMEGIRGTHLEARLVERVRQWIATKVSNPSVLSADDEDFIKMIAEPWDEFGTIVNLHTYEATSHLIRLTNVAPADMHSLAVMAWSDERHQAARAILISIPEFAAFYDGRPDESLHVIITGLRPELDAEAAIAQHREMMGRDWYRQHHGVDPESIRSWRVIEHRELLDENRQSLTASSTQEAS